MSLHLSSIALALLTCSYPTLCVAAVNTALPQAISHPLTPAIQLEQAPITLPTTAKDSIDLPQPEQAAPQDVDSPMQLKQD